MSDVYKNYGGFVVLQRDPRPPKVKHLGYFDYEIDFNLYPGELATRFTCAITIDGRLMLETTRKNVNLASKNLLKRLNQGEKIPVQFIIRRTTLTQIKSSTPVYITEQYTVCSDKVICSDTTICTEHLGTIDEEAGE